MTQCSVNRCRNAATSVVTAIAQCYDSGQAEPKINKLTPHGVALYSSQPPVLWLTRRPFPARMATWFFSGHVSRSPASPCSGEPLSIDKRLKDLPRRVRARSRLLLKRPR